MSFPNLYEAAVALLKELISLPSFSKEEELTADVLAGFLEKQGIAIQRKQNNVWAVNRHFRNDLPTILLNSHHDTVKPNQGYTRDPFTPITEDGKLYGLGSNDAGGALVSLLSAFVHFYNREDLKYNLVIAATAEEENSGVNGIELVLPDFPPISFAIVGEPTQMHLAIAEKGLMVVDCIARGRSGHAAREEGENALYKAMDDIQWLRGYQFDKVSPYLGPVKMTATLIESGTQHNVVPDTCKFTLDIRSTEQYLQEEILDLLRKNMQSEIHPRSTRLKPSFISPSHPIVQAGVGMGRNTYGSPTTSDQAVIPVPSLKLGPGDSARSHTADEFIYLDEIREGIELYIRMLEQVIT